VFSPTYPFTDSTRLKTFFPGCSPPSPWPRQLLRGFFVQSPNPPPPLFHLNLFWGWSCLFLCSREQLSLPPLLGEPHNLFFFFFSPTAQREVVFGPLSRQPNPPPKKNCTKSPRLPNPRAGFSHTRPAYWGTTGTFLDGNLPPLRPFFKAGCRATILGMTPTPLFPTYKSWVFPGNCPWRGLPTFLAEVPEGAPFRLPLFLYRESFGAIHGPPPRVQSLLPLGRADPF